MLTDMPAWQGVGLVVLCLLVFLAGLKFLTHRYRVSPELSRKIMHMGMGLVTLSFPFLFERIEPVLVLCGLTIVLFLGIRFLQPLNYRLGGIMGGVARVSWGELYFPIAVVLLFWLSRGNVILYGIPILILTLADAMSALIGIQYGQHQYTTSEGAKTIEGSLTFFTIAFLGTHLPLLLYTQTGRLESVLIALIMGLLLMIMEGIALRGLDNLFVPLGAFFFLKLYLSMPVPDLLHRLLFLLPIFVLLFPLRRWSELKGSAILLGWLCLYTFWALGGVNWLLAPLLVFLMYPFLLPPREDRQSAFGLTPVLVTISAGMIWLLVYRIFELPESLLAQAISFSAHLAIIMATGKIAGNKADSRSWLILKSVGLAGGVVLLPFLLMNQLLTPKITMASFALLILILMVFLATQKNLEGHALDRQRWWYRGAVVFVGSCLSLWFV